MRPGPSLPGVFDRSGVAAQAADGEAVLGAGGAGEEGQVPVVGQHILGLRRAQLLKIGDGVGKPVAVRVGKEDRVAGLQLRKIPEKAAVIVPENDKIVQIRRPGVPAGRKIQQRIAPIPGDRERQL